MVHVLGLTQAYLPKSESSPELMAKVQVLVDKRQQAKLAKDFATADKIRAELEALGVLLVDGPNETIWSINA
jgi:cysteinyl-tRNA synthetase